MLNDNLIMLRKINGYSQEEIAEKVGISRQAYAKWEKGLTIPDVEKCGLLAELYETTIDALVNLIPEVSDYSDYCKSNLRKHQIGAKNDERKAAELKKKKEKNEAKEKV